MNLKEKGMTSEISLSEDLIDMRARSNHRVSLLKPYLFVPVCLLIELHENLKVCCVYFFFSKIGVSKLGMGLINGCGLYMDFYGRLVLKEVFLETETNVFALQRPKKFLVGET